MQNLAFSKVSGGLYRTYRDCNVNSRTETDAANLTFMW